MGCNISFWFAPFNAINVLTLRGYLKAADRAGRFQLNMCSFCRAFETERTLEACMTLSTSIFFKIDLKHVLKK